MSDGGWGGGGRGGKQEEGKTMENPDPLNEQDEIIILFLFFPLPPTHPKMYISEGRRRRLGLDGCPVDID